MYNQAQMKHSNAYQQNAIMGLSPMQLVLKVYDYAILGCKANDADKVCRALVELISALRFEYEEISVGLFRLYQYCMDEVKQEKFDNAEKILIGLRDTWKETNSQPVDPNVGSIAIDNNA